MKAFPPHFHDWLMVLCLMAGGLLLTLTSDSALKKGVFSYFSRQALATGMIVLPCSSVRITMAKQTMKEC